MKTDHLNRIAFRKIHIVLLICMLLPVSVFGQEAGSSSGNSEQAEMAAILAQRYADSREKYVAAEMKLKELEAKREAVTSRLDRAHISDAAFADVMRLLQTQRVQLMIDLAGLEARRNLTVENGATNNRGNGGSASHEMIAMLEKYVANQQRATEEVAQRVDSGVIPSGDMRAAEKLFLEAQIRLEEARSRGASNGPGDSSTSTTGIAMEFAEKKARLAMVEKLLGEYVEVRPSIEMSRHLSDQYEVLQQRYQEARDVKERWEQQLRNGQRTPIDN